MTEQKITEGNKMIAVFMGWRKDTVHGWLPLNKTDSWEYGKDEYLKYNSSWDWLMPVIKKCYLVEAPTKEGWSKANRIQYRINENDFYFNNIICVHEQVVEFIVWYNNQNKQTIKK